MNSKQISLGFIIKTIVLTLITLVVSIYCFIIYVGSGLSSGAAPDTMLYLLLAPPLAFTLWTIDFIKNTQLLTFLLMGGAEIIFLLLIWSFVFVYAVFYFLMDLRNRIFPN